MNDDDKNAVAMLSRGGELFFAGRDHVVARLETLATLESTREAAAAATDVLKAANLAAVTRVAELETRARLLIKALEDLKAALLWARDTDDHLVFGPTVRQALRESPEMNPAVFLVELHKQETKEASRG